MCQKLTSFIKSKTLKITDDIRKYRRDPFNYTDKQIQSQLGLTERMWYRYNKIVNEQDKEIWLSITRTHLETELLNLKESLEDTYRIALYESNRKDIEVSDKLACLQAKDDARLSIVQLLTEGPDYIKHVDESIGKKERGIGMVIS